MAYVERWVRSILATTQMASSPLWTIAAAFIALPNNAKAYVREMYGSVGFTALSATADMRLFWAIVPLSLLGLTPANIGSTRIPHAITGGVVCIESLGTADAINVNTTSEFHLDLDRRDRVTVVQPPKKYGGASSTTFANQFRHGIAVMFNNSGSLTGIRGNLWLNVVLDVEFAEGGKASNPSEAFEQGERMEFGTA